MCVFSHSKFWYSFKPVHLNPVLIIAASQLATHLNQAIKHIKYLVQVCWELRGSRNAGCLGSLRTALKSTCLSQLEGLFFSVCWFTSLLVESRRIKSEGCWFLHLWSHTVTMKRKQVIGCGNMETGVEKFPWHFCLYCIPKELDFLCLQWKESETDLLSLKWSVEEFLLCITIMKI